MYTATVESVQQIGGNLMSAILVPIAERLAEKDFELFPHASFLASDIRGDAILLIGIAVATCIFFSGFDAPLRRTMADQTTPGRGRMRSESSVSSGGSVISFRSNAS